MKNLKRRYIVGNFIITLITGILVYIFFKFVFPGYLHYMYAILLLIALVVNIFTYQLSTRSRKKDVLAVMKSFIIRFMLYLIVAIVYLVSVDDIKKRVAFIITMFCIYLIFSFFETTSVVKALKLRNGN